MKIFLIKFNACDYDQYDGFVIVAKNRYQVIKRVKEESSSVIDFKSGYVISEIKPEKYKKTTVILDSFNAG